jgi:hypothetical protein
MACGLAAMAAVRADAGQTLSYDTYSSTFSGASGVTVTNDSVAHTSTLDFTASNGAEYQITFHENAVSNADFGTTVSLGSFTFKDVSGKNGPDSVPSGVQFTLTIDQTDPSVGTNSTSATLIGTLQKDAAKGDLILTFSNASLLVPSAGGPDSVTYALQGVDPSSFKFTLLPNIASISNTVALNAIATANLNPGDAVAPEPSTLLGACTAAVAGLGYASRRRGRAAA